MTHRVAVIPGDGIGRDVIDATVPLLDALGGLDLHPLPWSADHYLATGETMPEEGYDLLRGFDAILVGALGDPRVPDNRHARDILLGTRVALDLYVNHRPVRLLADRLCPLKGRTRADVDFVVFRENTEGLYAGIGGRFKAGTDDEVAVQEEINTYKGVHRIVRYAFEYARKHGIPVDMQPTLIERYESGRSPPGGYDSYPAPLIPQQRAPFHYGRQWRFKLVSDMAQERLLLLFRCLKTIAHPLQASAERTQISRPADLDGVLPMAVP